MHSRPHQTREQSLTLIFEASSLIYLYELAAALLPHKEILAEERTVCEASTTHNSKRAFLGANHLDNPRRAYSLCNRF